MLKSKYKAFEIQDDKVSETVVEGNLIAIADFIKNCKEGSIITIHMLEGEPFLILEEELYSEYDTPVLSQKLFFTPDQHELHINRRNDRNIQKH